MENKKSSKKFYVIIGIVVVVLLTYGITKYRHSIAHEETDDAQVEKNMTPIIPRVGGYVTKVFVKDNDYVKKGDTLFIIDNKDYLVKLEEAKAALASAESSYEVSKADTGSSKASISVSDANVSSASGSIETAKIRLGRATNDFERYNNLYKNHSITKQQYEQALATKQEAESQLKILIDQQKAVNFQKSVVISKSLVSSKQTNVAAANTIRAKAVLEAAKLNLSYTVVIASIDGQVSRINLQPGQLIQAGQTMFYLVDNNDVWVIANFKETQLSKMKLGQEVTISIDAYDGEVFSGELKSFSPATGGQFSILPPDNATGNFVKTIQRLPVKIAFKDSNDKEKMKLLRSGMNANVDVHVQ